MSVTDPNTMIIRLVSGTSLYRQFNNFLSSLLCSKYLSRRILLGFSECLIWLLSITTVA